MATGLDHPPDQARDRARLSPEGLEHRRVLVSAALRVLASAALGALALDLAWRLRALLLLIVVALFIAALLEPFVQFLEGRRLRRASAVGVVYLVLIVIAAVLGYTLFHPVYTSAVSFARELPSLVRQAQHGRGQIGALIKRLHLESYVATHAPSLESLITKFGKPTLAVGKTVLSGVASLVTIAFMSFFILLEAPRVLNGALSVTSPERAALTRRVLQVVGREVTGFMLGDFATSIIAGIIIYVTLRITNVPFASVLAIWVALVDFLPLVGGLLAGVVVVGVAFLHSLPAGIATLVVFLAYQQVENHVLYPIIVSKTVRLNPLYVLLAVLLGTETGSIVGSSFGAICGAIISVPAAGSLQVMVQELYAARRERAVPAR